MKQELYCKQFFYRKVASAQKIERKIFRNNSIGNWFCVERSNKPFKFDYSNFHFNYKKNCIIDEDIMIKKSIHNNMIHFQEAPIVGVVGFAKRMTELDS